MSNKEAIQFSALEVDDDLAECAFNHTVLVSVLLSICLTHSETVKDVAGVYLV